MDPMVLKLRDKSLFIGKCYVNGQWVTAQSRKTFKVFDPATNELVGTCPDSDTADAHRAINAASEALCSFRQTPVRDRSRMLRRWYDLIMQNQDDLAKLITWENGKPLVEAKSEVAYAAAFVEWFSEECPRLYGDSIPVSVPGTFVVTIREPVGVCGLITPWNFPAAMITRKIAPALAAGCTVVAKSPGETPFTANALAELAHRAGVPPGVVNILTSLDNTVEVGRVLSTHPSIKKVSFTGSTRVGKLLMNQAASTVKRVSWELGGNAPFIVFDDVGSLDDAVDGLIASKFRGSGQTCVCANRIYVHRSCYDDFAAKLVAKVRQFQVGPGFMPGVTHGPLIHAAAADKVMEHIEDAKAKGARVLLGGERMEHLGTNYVQPTVLADMTHDMRLASEETFGPVAALFPFNSEDEVIGLANNCEVGLAAYLYSRSAARMLRVAKALEVGMVGANTGIISNVASPFGGVKESGFGREGSKYGIDEFTHVKTITIGGL
ncbi:NAD-dependent succinate-semialdehyde dehydrogenase [Aspergillus fischeri NRRL 181]|uniref:Succinate-semialdehyde dehydrogenase n=1 Tax=Neosartorya fischeri (strain ATCC 1020 / DSM 3700 / CBS 544.65 / FGSC A1164 / JCM 1740 / NRRL 181 / WB 181) TaxID=331117 RepID=A1DK65_NEOFI|nr:succinate semialdehyde dehydrogenase [Aspergillus fischeri NRRL 181]EAW17104.1 succinate semialdehyde dehydrogenase [Aspergillus fischeri NRRL 181]